MSITPFNTFVQIVTKGTAVQMSATSKQMRTCWFIAPDSNQGAVYLGIGSGTSSTLGNYFHHFQPGDRWEFMSQHLDICIDASDLWINNSNDAFGFNSDGLILAKITRE